VLGPETAQDTDAPGEALTPTVRGGPPTPELTVNVKVALVAPAASCVASSGPDTLTVGVAQTLPHTPGTLSSSVSVMRGYLRVMWRAQARVRVRACV
jgi:hypothetical protein